MINNNVEYVCPCCRLEEVIDTIREIAPEFYDIILEGTIEPELIPVVDLLEDCFTATERAMVKLHQARGNDVIMVNNQIKLIPQSDD